jgi:uncharacterized membrane protein
MTSVLAVIAVTVIGLMVGVEFAVAFVINPILLRLPAGASLTARADGGRLLGRVMPFWYVGSTLLVAGTALVKPEAGTLAWTAVALLLVSVVLSVTLLVPINDRSKTWTPETAPDDHRDQARRWDRLHLVRLAAIVAAFVLVATASTA